MSFSKDVKNELAKVTNDKTCCLNSYITAQVLYNAQKKHNLLNHIALPALQQKYGKWTDEVCGKRQCCHGAFIRGAILACSHFSEPQKGYRVDFRIHNENALIKKSLADGLYRILKLNGIPSTIVSRPGNELVIYCRGSENIVDLLTLAGAVKSAFIITDIIIIKELNNDSNRFVNCETANIDRSVEAAQKQISAIKKLISANNFEDLPEELLEIANLRLDNPELSLTDLGNLTSKKISKAAVSRRLKRIQDLSQNFYSNNN